MTVTDATNAEPDPPRRLPRILRRTAKVAGTVIAAVAVAVTAASFGYNLATDAPPPRPAHLLFARGGGWDTRYLEWGTHGTSVILVPGAFETADTFAGLGPVLAENHRVFAIDLSGTGYSAPNAPFSATHLAGEILAFLMTEKLTGPDAPVLVGHSAGAADVGIAALQDPRDVRGVVFLDGDAAPFPFPALLGTIASTLFINPYRTSALRLALSQDWLIKNTYNSQCGPACPRLDNAGVNTWRWPLEQPGFQAEIIYSMRHGVNAMTAAQFAALKRTSMPKLIVAGVSDPEMPHSDLALTAQRIGAPPPVYVPGRHLTMIASPRQVAAAINSVSSR